MATILRGNRKGEEVELHQWANDWFTTEDGKVLAPSSLQLTASEMETWRQRPSNMDRFYELLADGRFKKIRPQFS